MQVSNHETDDGKAHIFDLGFTCVKVDLDDVTEDEYRKARRLIAMLYAFLSSIDEPQ